LETRLDPWADVIVAVASVVPLGMVVIFEEEIEKV
jgi:hypothetical protein